jgi:hypothetical protein
VDARRLRAVHALGGATLDDRGFTLDTFDGRDQLVYPTFVLSRGAGNPPSVRTSRKERSRSRENDVRLEPRRAPVTGALARRRMVKAPVARSLGPECHAPSS